MVIEITQEDIDTGIRGGASCCPIARAMRRQTNKKWYVHERAAEFFDENKCLDHVVKLPFEAVRFIKLFDEQKNVSPFEFEIDLK